MSQNRRREDSPITSQNLPNQTSLRRRRACQCFPHTRTAFGTVRRPVRWLGIGSLGIGLGVRARTLARRTVDGGREGRQVERVQSRCIAILGIERGRPAPARGNQWALSDWKRSEGVHGCGRNKVAVGEVAKDRLVISKKACLSGIRAPACTRGTTTAQASTSTQPTCQGEGLYEV